MRRKDVGVVLEVKVAHGPGGERVHESFREPFTLFFIAPNTLDLWHPAPTTLILIKAGSILFDIGSQRRRIK